MSHQKLTGFFTCVKFLCKSLREASDKILRALKSPSHHASTQERYNFYSLSGDLLVRMRQMNEVCKKIGVMRHKIGFFRVRDPELKAEKERRGSLILLVSASLQPLAKPAHSVVFFF